MRECTKCELPKELSAFSKSSSATDGFHLWCKECCKQYRRARAEGQDTSRVYVFKDFTGQVFERLTVIKFAGRKNGSIIWLVRCACGKEKTVTSGYLRPGRLSCGCIRKLPRVLRLHPTLAEVMIVPLTRGMEALIDSCDAAEIGKQNWCAHLCKKRFYGTSSGVYLHHFLRDLWGWEKSEELDHENGNSLDCRRQNLRPSTCAQNNANKKVTKQNRSGFKGVSRLPGGKWDARISRHNRPVLLGAFETPEAAAHAYDASARSFYGEFARLNFPREGERSAL